MAISKQAIVALVLAAGCDSKDKQTVAPNHPSENAAQATYEPVVDASATPGAHPDEDALNAYAEVSVRWVFEEFVSEDSANLDKVRAALAKAKPDMYVHVARSIETPAYEPAPRRIGNVEHAGAGGYWPTSEDWDPAAPGLMKYGGVPVGGYEEEGGHGIRIHRPQSYPPPLAENTPGVVWEVDGDTVWFVTLDGGRYRLAWSDLARGLPAQNRWPASVQHALLSDEDVDLLSRSGALPRAEHEALGTIDAEFRQCTADAWTGFEEEVDKLAAKNLTGSTRRHRIDVMRKKRRALVEQTCAKHVEAMDAALARLIEARIDDRNAVFTAASARATSSR